MQQVYFKRMTKQDITKSVAICTESVESFWGISKDVALEYTPIKICSERNVNYFPEGITIHKGYQGEKDWRITGSEFKKLYCDDNPEVGDLMCIKKCGNDIFHLSIIKTNTPIYDFLKTLFKGSDNYLILSKSEDTTDLNSQDDTESYSTRNISFDKNLLTAMKTKPFLLLAGISGTGKSRIVKQMAFESCPNVEALRSDKTSPGNYQLIEVKPNWHDSTEVLGYESEIGGKHYVATPFVKFLVKAMCYEDKAPFFVCMDEMNLAPVEQYFAEFLSVLESRKLVDGKITSEPLIKADIFKNHENQLRADLLKKADASQIPYGDNATSDPIIEYGKFNEIYERLKVEGLRIPSNLIVVGTVNMDETTHQFSRKVIDRAMTIEMNIEDAETPFKNFFEDSKDLEYKAKEEKKELFLSTVVQAKEALDKLSEGDKKHLIENIPTILHNLNQALNGTPFKIAYRVQNELVIYFYELRQEKENVDVSALDLLNKAVDAILMLKVLPRIEGDEDLLEKPLEKLHKFTEGYTEAHKKVEEMQARLNGGHFTSFWP